MTYAHLVAVLLIFAAVTAAGGSIGAWLVRRK